MNPCRTLFWPAMLTLALPTVVTARHLPLANSALDPIVEQTRLVPPGATWDYGDLLGYSVDISGKFAVVGAPWEDSHATGVDGDGSNDSSPSSGAAYVYELVDGAWVFRSYLKASDSSADHWFGYSVAIDGDLIAVSAPGRNGATGAVYMFERTGSTWTQQSIVTAAFGSGGDNFGGWTSAWSLLTGHAIDLWGGTLVVGAPNEDSASGGVNGDPNNELGSDSGAVYVFVRCGSQWIQQAYLKATYPGVQDRFGNAVAISGDTIVVGAVLEDGGSAGVNGDPTNNDRSQSGAAYAFVRTGTTWSQQAYLKAAVVNASEIFGVSVGISGDTIAVGSPSKNCVSGAVTVYERSGSAWSLAQTLNGEFCGHHFGSGVAVDQDLILVGGRMGDGPAGAAHVFARAGSSWIGIGEITGSSAGPEADFGRAVALSGDYGCVGAPGEGWYSYADPLGGHGAAYVYSLGTGATPLPTESGGGSSSGAPTASAGPDQAVAEGSFVTLSGSSGPSPCGTPIPAWSQLAGPLVTLDTNDPYHPTFTAPDVPAGGATLTFQLTVSVPGASATDVVNVTVTNINRVPVALAGDDQAVFEGSPVSLDGSNSYDFDDDSLSFAWEQLSGPTATLDLTDPQRPAFIAPEVAVGGEFITFQLTVDDSMATASDSVSVFVEHQNHDPIAVAGLDQTRGESTLVTLDGSASSDPDGDSLTHFWVQLTGSPATLSDPTLATPTFTAPSVGVGGEVLVFRLTVDDGFGGLHSDEVSIAIQDSNAGPDCSRARASVAELWPPNHKLIPISVQGVVDPENDAVTITILGVTQDEPINGLGDGDTSPDAVIGANGAVLLRSERSGGGNGRVYRINYLASDGHGGSCTGTITVVVPHSRGKNAASPIDDGQAYNSFGG